MKKKIIACILTITLALGAAACSSDNGAEQNSDTSTGSGEDSSASAGGVEIEFFSSKSENISTMQSLVDKFNESQDGITVKLTAPEDAGTVLKTRLTKNDMPDVLAIGGDSLYTELQSSDILEDISEEAFMSDLEESYVEMLYLINKDKEEKAYGAPYATNASGILYNKDIFEAAGVDIPKTWDELLAVCETLQDQGVTPFEFTFKDAWTIQPVWNALAPSLIASDFTDERKLGNVTFAETHDVVFKQYLELMEYAQNDYMGTSYDDGNANFANGSAAMMVNGIWAIPEFLKINPDMNVDSFAFPATNDAASNPVISGVDVLLAITTYTDNKDAAVEFVQFMLDPENSKQYITEQFAFSPVAGVEQDDPTVEGLLTDINDGKVADFIDHYYPNGFELGNILSEFFLNVNNGMEADDNISTILQKLDTEYDVVNID